MNKQLLWITNNWFFDFGGRKMASKKILNFLIKKNFGVTVLDFEIKEKKYRTFSRYTNLSNKINFHVVYLKSNKKIVFENFAFAKKKKFDLVVMSGSAPVDILSILSIRLFNLYKTAKKILFEHTNPEFGIRSSDFWIMHKTLAHMLYRTFDSIVVPSASLKDIYRNKFHASPDKIKVIHYPVVNKKNHNLTSKSNIGSKKMQNRIVIVTIARLNLRQKDFKTLFKAISLVILAGKRVELQVLGTGPDFLRIKKLAEELYVKKNVKLLGYKKNPFKYLYNGDIFVLSSRFEGAPLALVEAMACGIPVVATDCPVGPRDILDNGKNGLLIDVGDTGQMANSILRIADDIKLRRKLILNGLSKSREYLERDSLNNWYNFLIQP